MSKKVIYTVGANLNGLIEVEHFVDGDTSKTKKQKNSIKKCPHGTIRLDTFH